VNFSKQGIANMKIVNSFSGIMNGLLILLED